MNKRLSIIISLFLALSLFAGGTFAFAENIEPDKTMLTYENCTVILSGSEFVYTGNKITPDAEIKYNNGEGEVTLNQGVDYLLAYAKNTLPGKASVTVTGTNNYAGELTQSFVIVPAKTDGVKASETAILSFTAEWTQMAGVDGYDVAVYKPNTEKWAHYNADKNSYKVTNLIDAKKYTVKVRAYKTVDGVKKYGAYSDEVNISTKRAVGQPKVDGYCDLTSNPVVTWKKVNNTTKYIIYRSLYKDKGFKEIARVDSSERSYTDKSAKVHKTYYYKVKSMRKLSGKERYGKPSDAVKIKAKKTVFVGDSIMEGVQYYNGIPGASYVVKIGMGTYTFYERNYFKAGKSTVTGVEKVISMKPDRIFIMLGMNEAAYKGNKGIIEYYEYAIEDFQDELKGVEIVILPVSPTKANSGKTIPKKKRITSYNKAIKAMAKENGCKFYDFTAPFKDSNGNLLNKYDGGDGCHWNPSACKLFRDEMLKYAKANR